MAEGFQDEDIPEDLDDSSSEADSISSFFERFTFKGLDADTAVKLKKRWQPWSSRNPSGREAFLHRRVVRTCIPHGAQQTIWHAYRLGEVKLSGRCTLESPRQYALARPNWTFAVRAHIQNLNIFRACTSLFWVFIICSLREAFTHDYSAGSDYSAERRRLNNFCEPWQLHCLMLDIDNSARWTTVQPTGLIADWCYYPTQELEDKSPEQDFCPSTS